MTTPRSGHAGGARTPGWRRKRPFGRVAVWLPLRLIRLLVAGLPAFPGDRSGWRGRMDAKKGGGAQGSGASGRSKKAKKGKAR